MGGEKRRVIITDADLIVTENRKNEYCYTEGVSNIVKIVLHHTCPVISPFSW